ncbi:MAG: alpha/beta hydrolase [Gemmatimonadaceae bacterium]
MKPGPWQWWMSLITPIVFAGALGCGRPSAQARAGAMPPDSLMQPGALATLPSQSPDARLAYGSDSSQVGELRVPTGAGPHPVAVLVHGGCFKAAYATRRDLAAMGDALKAVGIATWNVEYRRLDQPGGGWPGTYVDVATAIDHLRVLAREYPLDLSRVVLVGHSAGGHLALWAAGRARVPLASALHTPEPLPVRGVLDLAGSVDLTDSIARYERLCQDAVITRLMDGSPSTVPEHYASASPRALLPLGVPQVILIGEFEAHVPRPLAEAYVRAATQAGDSARLLIVPGAGHFEIASPRTSAWPTVLSAIQTLLDGRPPSRTSAPSPP